MRQLTALDAQFLALETPRQYGHVAGVAIVDPSTSPTGSLELVDLQDLLVDRLPLLPRRRWRLAEVPLGLDYAYWIDDPDFDLEYHVRELALPPPGSYEQLAEQVARIVSRPLDRARPLWELYLIHGLEGGHKAVMTKIHHSVIDGMSGAEIMGALLDLTPEGREVPEEALRFSDDGEPTELEMLGRGLLGLPRYPLRVLRALPATLPNIDETPLATLPGAGLVGRVASSVQRALGGGGDEIVDRHKLVAPKTSFNGRVSPHRRVVFGQLSLDAVKAAKNEHGGTVNDVIVSICAGAVRRWLIERDELLAEPLVAQIPVSVRTDDQVGTYGNRIQLMSAPLFTNVADPIDRLLRTHDAMGDMKARHRALPAGSLQVPKELLP